MDLQSVKAHCGAHWAWARTGALILFLVTALLLAVSLTGVGGSADAHAPLKTGTSISALIFSHSAS